MVYGLWRQNARLRLCFSFYAVSLSSHFHCVGNEVKVGFMLGHDSRYFSSSALTGKIIAKPVDKIIIEGKSEENEFTGIGSYHV